MSCVITAILTGIIQQV